MTFANKSPLYFHKCASGDGFSLCAAHTDLIDLSRGVFQIDHFEPEPTLRPTISINRLVEKMASR